MEREPGRPFECVATQDGSLRPTDPGRARALGERQGEVLVVREMTAAELRRDRQNRYWHVAVVGTIRSIWIAKGLIPSLTPAPAVHAALVTAFGGGLIETPLGPARTSSAMKTVREFNRMTEEARAYAWDTYQVRIPSGEEWSQAHAQGAGEWEPVAEGRCTHPALAGKVARPRHVLVCPDCGQEQGSEEDDAA